MVIQIKGTICNRFLGRYWLAIAVCLFLPALEASGQRNTGVVYPPRHRVQPTEYAESPIPTWPSGQRSVSQAAHLNAVFQDERPAALNGPQSNIEAILPEGAAPRKEPFGLNMPFQHAIPGDVRFRDPNNDLRREFKRFVPKVLDAEEALDVIAGRPRILNFTQPPKRLYLPDEQVARWDIISDTEVAVVGINPGTTVLSIWFDDPQAENGQRVLSFLVRVYEDPQFRQSLDKLEEEINELFCDSMVRLSIVGDRLVVRGQAKDAIEAGQILTLLAQTRDGGRSRSLAPGAGESVLLYQTADPLRDQERAAERRSVFDSVAIERAGIVNLLKIPGEQQVMLRVTVAEVNRSAIRSIGADMQIGTTGDVSFLSLLTPANMGATTGNFVSASGGNLLVNATDFRLALNALRELGYARTLAEPNLTTLNGRSAQFRAGDRFPIPAAQAGFGGVGQGVQFEFVGIEIDFVPYIVDRDRIRLTIEGEVSIRDDTQSANVGGTNVPGQNTREFETTVELRDGQTMAMAGLIQSSLRGQGDRIPFAGDLPIIGTLFSNRSNEAAEQELVVIVTPELVHSLEACAAPPLPGADLHEPTDVEFFLQNRMESRRGVDFRSPIRTNHARIHSFEKRCYDPALIGPSGHSYNCCDVPATAVPARTYDSPALIESLPTPATLQPLPAQR